MLTHKHLGNTWVHNQHCGYWCPGAKPSTCLSPLSASWLKMTWHHFVNTLRPRQNRRHFADDIFKCIFLNENVWILINISLKFVPKRSIDHIPALVQIMAWRRPGDKPLSEPMMISLPTHICVTRPQWVNDVSIAIQICQKIYLLKFHSW